MDIFLQPSTKYRVTDAVISLLAGRVEPPLAMRARLWLFYLAVRLQRSIKLSTPVPLMRVLEEGPPS